MSIERHDIFNILHNTEIGLQDKGDGSRDFMTKGDAEKLADAIYKLNRPIANNGVSLEEILKMILYVPNNISISIDEANKLAKAILLRINNAKLPTTAINNGVSVEEFRMHVLNVLKKRFPHVGEKSYENIKDAQDEIIAKLPTTAPRGGGEIKHADNCPSVKGAPVCTCEHLRRYS